MAVRCRTFSAEPVEVVGKNGPLNQTAVLAATFRPPLDPARAERVREPLTPRPAARVGTRESRPSGGGGETATTPLTDRRSLAAARASLVSRAAATSSPRSKTPTPSTTRPPRKRLAAPAPARPPTPRAGAAHSCRSAPVARPAESSFDAGSSCSLAAGSGRVRLARASAPRALSPGGRVQRAAVAACSAPPVATPRLGAEADSLVARAAALGDSALLDARPLRPSAASTARSAPGSPLEEGSVSSRSASDVPTLSGWTTDSRLLLAEVPAPQPRGQPLEPSEPWRARVDGLLALQAARADGDGDVATAAAAPRARAALASASARRVSAASTAWASPRAARVVSTGVGSVDALARRRLRAESAGRVSAASSSRRRQPRASKPPRSTSLAASRPRSSSAPPAARLVVPRVPVLPLPTALAPARPKASGARELAKQPPHASGDGLSSARPARASLAPSRAVATTEASSTSTPRRLRSSTPASTRVGGGSAARAAVAHVVSPRALAAHSSATPQRKAVAPARALTPPPRWSSGGEDEHGRALPPPTARPGHGVGAAQRLQSRRLSAEQRAEAIAFMRAKQRERVDADASNRAAAAAVKTARVGALSRLARFYAQPASSGGAPAVDACRRSSRISVASSSGRVDEVALPSSRASGLDALAAPTSTASASLERTHGQLLESEAAAAAPGPEAAKHELVYEAERRALEQIRIAGARAPELQANSLARAVPHVAEETMPDAGVDRQTVGLREEAFAVDPPRGWLLAEANFGATVPTASAVSAITAELLAHYVELTISSAMLDQDADSSAVSSREPRARVDLAGRAESRSTTVGVSRDIDASSAVLDSVLAPAAHGTLASMAAGMRKEAAVAASARSPESPRSSSPSAVSPMMAVWPATHERTACLDVRAATAGTRCPSGRPAALSASPGSPSSGSPASGARLSLLSGLDSSPALRDQPRPPHIRSTSPPGSPHAIFSLGSHAGGIRERAVEASADDREEDSNADALHFAAPYSSRRSGGAQQLSAQSSASVPPLPMHAQPSGGVSEVALVDDKRVKATMMDELDGLYNIATRQLLGGATESTFDAWSRGLGVGSQARSVLAEALCERPPSGVTSTRVDAVLRDLLHGSVVRDEAYDLAQAKANVTRLIDGTMNTLDGKSDAMVDLAEAVELENECADVRKDLGSILTEIERAIVRDLVADTASALARVTD